MDGTTSQAAQTAALRTARVRDAQTLLDIHRAAALEAFAHVFPPERYPFPSEAIGARWNHVLESRELEVAVALRRGRAVGFVAFEPGRLDSLYVVPDEWGSGAADLLYRYALRRLESWPGRPFRLWVLAENPRARRFYERRGWKADGRTRRAPFPPYPELVGYSLDAEL